MSDTENVNEAADSGLPQPRLVRDLLPDKQRHRAHNLCRLPKGYRLLEPFEKIVGGCKFTRPNSPEWVECMVGEIHRGYDPAGYFIHCIPNGKDQL